MALSGTTLFISQDYSYNPTSSLLITFWPSQTITWKWYHYKGINLFLIKSSKNLNFFY